MFNSNESVQLFRSKVTYQTVRLHVTPDNPPNYLFSGDICTEKDMSDCNWYPIESSEYLGIPNLETLGPLHFQDYVQGIKHGANVAEFLEDFLGVEDPIGEAICSVLYDIQNNGQETPYNFVAALRAYCEANS
jgi:hypothetical protein